MKQKGRYNIKIAEKNGVIIKKTNLTNGLEFEEFCRLTDETTRRDGFFSNPKQYYSNLINSLTKDINNSVYIYSAFYNNKIVASAITTFIGNKAMYYYGASSNEDRNIMAPYLLQWEMIKDAMKNKCYEYDFLGVGPEIFEQENKFYIFEGLNKYEFIKKEDAEKFVNDHKFSGITQFKTRFGGNYISYIGAIDKVFNPILYYLLIELKNIRKFLRNKLKIRI